MIEVENNLRLEPIDKRFSKALIQAISNNRDHLSPFLPWVPNMQTEIDSQNYIANCEMLSALGKEVSFVILLNEELVGRIGLHHLDQANRKASIGYWLTKNAEGNGIILKSCRKLIPYGFEKLHLQRIEITAAVENSRSQAIPEKLHFKKEGILRSAELINNRYHDLVVYSILKDEWSVGV
jgi:ribosomal-protein-serine acetyltransferase